MKFREKMMNIADFIEQIEQIQKEQESIYHHAAVRFGISDTVMWILYNIYESKEIYTQQELCKKCFWPKQTVNTAVANLVKNGYVRLEMIPGTRNQKKILLTQAGIELAQNTTEYVKAAELRAYGKLSKEELRMLLDVNQKLTSYLREEMEKELKVTKGEQE